MAHIEPLTASIKAKESLRTPGQTLCLMTGLQLRNLNEVTIMGVYIYIVNNRVSPSSLKLSSLTATQITPSFVNTEVLHRDIGVYTGLYREQWKIRWKLLYRDIGVYTGVI